MELPLFQLLNQLFLVIAYGSVPILILSAGCGFLIAVIQGLTQLNEQTLPQVVKLLAAAVGLMMLSRFLFSPLLQFTRQCFQLIIEFGR